MEMTMKKTPPKWRKALIAAGCGAVGGFAGALAFTTLSHEGALGDIGRSGEIAGLIGMVYLLTALAIGVGVLSPSVGARFLNVEDAGELEEQRRLLGSSSVSSGGIGIAMILLALAQPAGILPVSLVLAGVAVLLALVVWLGVLQRRQVDELMRSLSLESMATAFYLVALVGGGWSILAHLELAAGPQPLDWISMFAGLTLAAAFIKCAQRGLLKPR